MNAQFDPRPALRALVSHDVRFVIVGGIAGILLGSPALTFDLDICYSRDEENLDALARTLVSLKATLRGAPADLPFQLDGKTLKMGDSFTFDTVVGSLDCLGTPSGTIGYSELLKNAREVIVDGDLHVMVASIDDLIRMKRAAGRPKDRIAVEILTALKEEREKLTRPE